MVILHKKQNGADLLSSLSSPPPPPTPSSPLPSSPFSFTMVFSDLEPVLGCGEDGNLNVGTSVVIEECAGADGAFLLHHFLGLALRSRVTRVCLISFTQARHHYESVARRLGCRLDDATRCTPPRYQFFDALSSLHSSRSDDNGEGGGGMGEDAGLENTQQQQQQQQQQPYRLDWAGVDGTAARHTSASSVNDPFGPLLERVRAFAQAPPIHTAGDVLTDSGTFTSSPAVQPSSSTTAAATTTTTTTRAPPPCVILIDGLSLLPLQGVSVAACFRFLRACHVLSRDSNGTLVAALHLDGKEGEMLQPEEGLSTGDAAWHNTNNETAGGVSSGGGGGSFGEETALASAASDLCRYFAYGADTRLSVSALSSGRSTDVHGRLVVTRRTTTTTKATAVAPSTVAMPTTTQQQQQTQQHQQLGTAETNLLFRAREQGVDFFAPGLAAGMV